MLGNKKIISLIGLPGVGKGTHLAFIMEQTSYFQITVGDLLRNIANNNSHRLFDKVSQFISKGMLVPTEIVVDVLYDAMQKNSKGNDGFILDGFPRSLEQDQILIDKFSDTEIIYLYFQIQPEMLKKRILGRFICKKCNAIYNEFYCNTKQKDICDYCASNEFFRRKDDNEEILEERIKSFNNTTMKLINKYQSSEKFFTINANNSLEEIRKDISEILKNI